MYQSVTISKQQTYHPTIQHSILSLHHNSFQPIHKMHDRSQPPPRSASCTQLYIVVNPFSSHEQVDLPHDNSFFASRNLWSVVVQRPYHWLMQQGLLVDGDPCRRITGNRVTIEHPDRQLLYFEVASFKGARLDDVNHIIRSTDPEDADDTLECNRKWVRDILGNLVACRILSRNKADKILFELEMSCTEIQFRLQRF